MSWGPGLRAALCTQAMAAPGAGGHSAAGVLKPDLPSSSQCTAFSSWKSPSHTHLSTTPHLSDAGLPAVHRRALGPTDTGPKGLGGASAPIRLSDGGLFSLEWAGDFDFGGEGRTSNKAEPRGLIFTQHLRGLSLESISVGILSRPC